MLHAAILGSGFIAGTHVEALRSSRILIDAVVGRTMEKAKAFAEKWEISGYGTDMEVLFAEQIDMLYPNPVPGGCPFAVSSEDAAVISFRFADGAIGAVTLSEISQGRCNHLSLEITGERQTLWWNAETNNLLCFAEKGRTVRSIVCAFGNGFTDTFRSLIRKVYRDIASGFPSESPSYPTVTDGARNVLFATQFGKVPSMTPVGSAFRRPPEDYYEKI